MVTEFTKGILYLPLQPCLSHYAYVELVKLPLQAPQLYAVWGLAQLLLPVLGPKLVFRVGVVYTMLMALAPAYPFRDQLGQLCPHQGSCLLLSLTREHQDVRIPSPSCHS